MIWNFGRSDLGQAVSPSECQAGMQLDMLWLNCPRQDKLRPLKIALFKIACRSPLNRLTATEMCQCPRNTLQGYPIDECQWCLNFTGYVLSGKFEWSLPILSWEWSTLAQSSEFAPFLSAPCTMHGQCSCCQLIPFQEVPWILYGCCKNKAAKLKGGLVSHWLQHGRSNDPVFGLCLRSDSSSVAVQDTWEPSFLQRQRLPSMPLFLEVMTFFFGHDTYAAFDTFLKYHRDSDLPARPSNSSVSTIPCFPQ